MSQRNLAESLGVDQGTLQSWEVGQHKPVGKNGQLIETFLGGGGAPEMLMDNNVGILGHGLPRPLPISPFLDNFHVAVKPTRIAGARSEFLGHLSAGNRLGSSFVSFGRYPGWTISGACAANKLFELKRSSLFPHYCGRYRFGAR